MSINDLPSKLTRPPLVEAVLEVRFASSKEPVGDLLPGLLHGRLKDRFPRTETLQLASVPRDVRERNSELRYRPHIRLAGRDRALLIGDRVVTLSRMPPYEGWHDFRALGVEIFTLLKETSLLDPLNRYSFKCINVLEYGRRHPLDLLEANLSLGRFPVQDGGLRIRSQIEHKGFQGIVELGAPVTIESAVGSKSGLLLSIDATAATTSADFWPNVESRIDAAHDVVKDVFFGLLKKETIEEFGPSWE